MNAQKESTLFFAEKTGDTMLVELKITGNPDDVVNTIMKSITTNTELFKGATCEQLYFKGKNIDTVVKDASQKAIVAIEDSLIELKQKIKGDGI